MLLLDALMGWLGHLGTPKLDVAFITPSLAVGAAPRGSRLGELAGSGISAALDLRTDAERTRDPGWDQKALQAGVDVLRLPIEDDAAPTQEMLTRGSSWLLGKLGQDRLALVCCRMGQRRSVTLATATLVRMGYGLPEAFRLISKARWKANPTNGQLAALREFAEQMGTKEPLSGGEGLPSNFSE